MLILNLVVVILLTLLTSIAFQGGSWLSWDFLTSNHAEDNPEASGVYQAIIGTFVTCLVCGLFAIPVGIGTAVFLEEYKPSNFWLRQFHGLVQLNINNLAGVPSIVYGILGLTVFVYMFGVFGKIEVNQPAPIEMGATYEYQIKTLGKEWVRFKAFDRNVNFFEVTEPVEITFGDGTTAMLNVIPKSESIPTDKELKLRSVFSGAKGSIFRSYSWYYFQFPFGKGVLAAGLTLALVILPIIIIATQEALRGVPDSLRQATFGLGANRWQVVKGVVLPSATPGIMTGAILAMSRAVGEAAPVLAVMGGVLGTTKGLTSLMDKSPILPITIYQWASDDNNQFENLSAAAIIVLLVFLLMMNAVAIFIRYRLEKRNRP